MTMNSQSPITSAQHAPITPPNPQDLSLIHI